MKYNATFCMHISESKSEDPIINSFDWSIKSFINHDCGTIGDLQSE